MNEIFEKTPVPRSTCNERHLNVEKSISSMSELYTRFAQSQEKHNEYIKEILDKQFDKLDKLSDKIEEKIEEINKQGLGVKIYSIEESLKDHKIGFDHWKPMAFIGSIVTGTVSLVVLVWQLLYKK
jgi:hypothetical protein